MARHGGSCESRFRQNFKKKFDWCAFNSNMLLADNVHRIATAHLTTAFSANPERRLPDLAGIGRDVPA